VVAIAKTLAVDVAVAASPNVRIVSCYRQPPDAPNQFVPKVQRGTRVDLVSEPPD